MGSRVVQLVDVTDCVTDSIREVTALATGSIGQCKGAVEESTWSYMFQKIQMGQITWFRMPDNSSSYLLYQRPISRMMFGLIQILRK